MMESQVKILGWLYIISGIIGLLGAVCLGVIIVGGGLISQDELAIRTTAIVAIGIGVFLAVISAPGIIAGWGLLSYRKWARIFTIVLGILNLPGFPVGTILGVYTLIVLLDDRVNPLFEKKQEQTVLSGYDL
jgi:MFS family permease